MRIAETYGPGDLRLLKLYRGIKRGRFLMIGPGRNRHALVHCDDVVRGLLLGVTTPQAAGETFVLAAGDDLTTREMVDAVAAAVSRPVPRLALPFWLFLLAARAGTACCGRWASSPPIHRRAWTSSTSHSLFRSRRPLGDWGMLPSSALRAAPEQRLAGTSRGG